MIEQEKRRGRQAPQRIFESFMETMTDWGKADQIEKIKCGSLTIFKHAWEPDPNDELGHCGDEIYGAVGENVIFLRDRRKSAMNGQVRLQSINWLLSAEGPIHYITYHNGWDGRRELCLGFAESRIAMGKGGIYSIDDGQFIEHYVHWDKFLVGKPFESPKLETVEKQNGNKIILEGWNNSKLLEEIILPGRVDLERWLPIFFDESEQAVRDSNLPWRSWLGELGLEYRSYINQESQ